MSKFKILLGLVHRLLELESSLAAAIAAGAETNAKLIAAERALKESNARSHELANKPIDVSRAAQDAAAAEILGSLGYAWVDPAGWMLIQAPAKNQDDQLISLNPERSTTPPCKRCGMDSHRTFQCKTHDAHGNPLGEK